MNKITIYFISILFLYLGLGCSNEQPAINLQTEFKFFDISGFFQKEIERLNKLQPSVEKSFLVNEASESTTPNVLDYQLEFSPFLEADINKKAWEDKYAIENTTNAIVYTALDDQLEIKEISIQMDSMNNPIHIQIVKFSESPLSYNKTTLQYYFQRKIEIVSTQKNILSSEKKIGTNIRFLN